MEWHKLLKRQLARNNVTFETLPANLEQWRAFLTQINKTYIDADQERYLVERSIKISSQEMMLLNTRLEESQHIAKLGYWFYDLKEDKITCSKEIYKMLGIKHLPSTFKNFKELVHPEDRKMLSYLVSRALNNSINFETEVRIKNKDNNYNWYLSSIRIQPDQNILGILKDIDSQKNAEKKIKKLSQEIISTAHRAGMSEIATSILHNVGNVLNSINVSIGSVNEVLKNTYLARYHQIVQLIKKHQHEIGKFFTEDEKGKLIPQYLIELGKQLEKELQENLHEAANIKRGVDHIRDIVEIQQVFSGVSAIPELVYVQELIENALHMTSSSFSNRNTDIEFKKVFNDNPQILIEKSKLLQVLINLIHNAKEAVSKNLGKKIIKIKIEQLPENLINICIADNGIGISTENLEKIFSFGFTTKKHGHGFGLHSSALSIQSMGGTIIATSKGKDEGTEFTITLPINPPTKEKAK